MDCEYVALCEGDDYWTHPNKLQMQVDYLDSHLEVGMVYTDYNQYYHCEGQMLNSMIGSGRKPKISDFETHLRLMGYIAPMSWVYRREFMNIARNYKGKASINGTFIFALEMFLNSKIQYLDCVTCVYRIAPGSATNKTSPDDIFKYERGLHETQLYYVKNYPVSKETVDSLDWFYEHHASYIVLNGISDEIVNARHYLRNHINKKESFKHLLFVICMLYPFSTELYKHWKKFRQLISKS